MVTKKDKADEFSKEESAQRFEAALRGSRSVGPRPMKEMPLKRQLQKPKNKK